ncbi:hypothetical protein EUX98_g6498 [Antrodiella citrinella]|uniref:Xylanolytic transcriptional activator regulatory domain-containing protein n=1 Tax=Antrodiella citrinella TaxID=2447956 RepID=A0A4S4MWC4_9APHY|nr:hypothetical protein EUX98_g6498 [Antrodiella citrinella]
MPTFTSRAEDFDPGVWSDHLQSSAGSSQGLGSSAGTSHTTTESTEATSVTDNSRHVDDTAEKSVPDETVPIGLIANLSLSDAETAEEMNDQDDSEGVLGWARKTYFKPGEPSVRPIIGAPGTSVEPASSTAVNPSPQMVQKNNLPDIVLHGLVTPSDVDKLFNIYFTFMNVHVDLLDPVLHTPTATFFKSPFLFSTICAIASRYYEEKPEMYPIAMHFAKHAAASALISGRTSVEIALAYMLLAYWTPPAKRWEEHRTWLYVGLGIRVAMDLNLHQVPPPKPTNERQEREQLNGVRMWMNCFILDRSISTYYGRPPTIKEDYVIRNVSKWYNSSQYNSPCDIGISAYCAMLQITTRFSEEIFSDPDAPTGLNKNVDFLEITITYDDLLRKYVEEWKERYIKHADLTDPQTLFRRYLLPYVSSYARLVMWSFVFQQAFQRGMQPRDSIIIDKCFEHASTVINSMVQNLAPSGYMRFASEGHYNFASFTSSFLVKLLKPEFAKLFDHKQQRQIFELIEQLIQTFSSIEVATDDKHTPRQHARFLSALLSKYRKGFPPGTLVPRHADEGPTSSSNVAVGQAPSGPEQTTGGSGPSWQEYQESTTYVPDLPGPSLADFDTQMSFDDEFMGALEVFKSPGYWESMMMPGLHWPGPVGDQSGDPPSVQDSGTYG